METLWPEIDRLARRQLGLVTAVQLIAAGVSSATLSRWNRTGRLVRVARGVYALPGSLPTWERRALVTVLASGEGALAAGPTAVRLHGLPLPLDHDGIHILRPANARGKVEGAVVHRSRLIVPADRSMAQRVPTSSIARTIVDVSGHPALDERTLRWMVDVARKRGMTLEQLERTARRLAPGPGRRPSRVLGVVDAFRGTNAADSIKELDLADILEHAGYGRPRLGILVELADGTRYKVDGGYDDCLVGFEYQGWEVHGDGSWNAFHEDPYRMNLLRDAGWEVFPFTSQSSEEHIVQVMGGAIERRRAELAGAARLEIARSPFTDGGRTRNLPHRRPGL